MKVSKLDKLQRLNDFARKAELQQQEVQTVAPQKTVLVPNTPKKLQKQNIKYKLPRKWEKIQHYYHIKKYIVLLAVDNNARMPKFIIGKKRIINGRHRQIRINTSIPITVTQVLSTPCYWFSGYQAMQEKLKLEQIKSNNPCVLSLKKFKSNFLNGNYNK